MKESGTNEVRYLPQEKKVIQWNIALELKKVNRKII
jgi:hypothetical protein